MRVDEKDFQLKRREPLGESSDPEVSRRRVEVAIRKAELGSELTEKEVLIVQRETAMNRCHSCGPRAILFHSPRRRGEDR